MSIEDVIEKYQDELNNIEEIIKKSNDIAIIGHLNPDGDCVGSQLGLKKALERIGKRVDAINVGVFKGIYKSLFQQYFISDVTKDYDLYLILDTANKERIGDLYQKIDLEKTIVIDHHITNNKFGKINWVSDNFISASEMIFLLILKMNIDISNSEEVQLLLNGLLSDNGFFQHIRNNKFLSLLISYKMMQMGADSKKSYDLMFCNNTIDTVKLFSLVLSRITPENNNKVLWSFLTEKDKKDNNNIDFESGMIFREMMAVKGTKVSIFFKVTESENKVEISLRSTDDVDVSKIATFFGGGGHKVAAGVSVSGDFEKIKKDILAKVNEILV